MFPDFATGNSREKSGAVETLLLQDPDSPVEEPTTAGEEKGEVLNMPQVNSIKDRAQDGISVAGIARELAIDEKTVRKYLRQDDFSPRPPEEVTRWTCPDPVDRRLSLSQTRRGRAYEKAEARREAEENVSRGVEAQCAGTPADIREVRFCSSTGPGDHDPLIITRKSNENLVLLSIEEYNSLIETNYLLGNEANAGHLRK